MILLTSISPNNLDRQIKAIQTWRTFKHKIVSFNCKEEADVLKDVFPFVEFLIVENTGIDLYGKHYIYLNDLVDYAKEHEDCVIINSDILINNIIPKSVGMECILYHRHDIQGYNYHKSIKLESGIDAFVLNRQTASMLPKTKLVLGQCHWDYWMAYMMIKNRVKIITFRKPIIFHEKHKIQYDMKSWERTAKIFMEETGIHGNSLQEVSSTAFLTIRRYTKIK